MLQYAERFLVGGGNIAGGGAGDLLLVGLHTMGEIADELASLFRRQPAVFAQNFARDDDAGGFTLARQQRLGQSVDVAALAAAAKRRGDQLAPLLCESGKKFL